MSALQIENMEYNIPVTNGYKRKHIAGYSGNR